MAQYLGFYDECDIRTLLKVARMHGATDVEVRDSEWNVSTFNVTDKAAIIDLIDGVDSDWAFRFEKEGEYLGTFYVVLGNDDGSAVYDSSCQAWCDKVWDAIA